MRLIERLHASSVADRRVRVLARHLAGLLPPDANVLDVGCGDGQVAGRIQQLRPDVRFQGLDVLVRQPCGIPVQPFDGQHLPCEDQSADVVMFVDVLHHTDDPLVLLREAVRVARRCIVLKDHTCGSSWDDATLRFMDQVGNRRHGVRLPYTYWTHEQWREAFARQQLSVRHWNARPGLYWWPASLVFDRSLQFIACLEPAAARMNNPIRA